MKRREFLSSLSAAPALAAAQSSDDFTSLFDGKTLAGWSIQAGPESAFYVRDSAIVVHQSGGFPTWLRSAGQYENSPAVFPTIPVGCPGTAAPSADGIVTVSGIFWPVPV